MGTIHVDGASYEADAGRNLLAVLLELGFDLPYFCWHPAFGSIGACRQCAITQHRDESDTEGRLVMACMTPAADGARVSVDHASARSFRASVIEWLMLNHPHDCPVCDEGGECHLQDMTVMAGHTYRRTAFRKRTYVSQDLGPLIAHEMNRCIQCYRCVRFYKDFAGGHDLQAMASRDRVYFGRHADGPLESEFAGNLVEVCPTGVFTDKTQARHNTRKWDLQTAPSVCAHCGVGCNTIPGARDGELRRVRARYHGAVNGYFLCDRGRYGYEFANSERRILAPLAPRGEERVAEELSHTEAVIRAARAVSSSRRVIGIGSPRATVESNFALQTLVGAESFVHAVCADEHRAVGTALELLRRGPSRTPPLREIERCDAVLVLGDDIAQSAPMMALAVRQAALVAPRREAEAQGIPSWHDAAIREAIQSRRGPVFVITPGASKLDDSAARAVRAPPGRIASIAAAIARDLDPRAPEPPPSREDAGDGALVAEIAGALKTAARPVVIAGALAGERVVRAAAHIAWAAAAARKDGAPAELAYALPWANSAGLSLLGGAPIERALDAAERGEVDGAILLECDLDRVVGSEAARRFMGRIRHTIAIDHIAHATAARASIVLPAATFAEGHGHLINSEARAQRQFSVTSPDGSIRESWRWLRDILEAKDRDAATRWDGLEAIAAAAAAAHPALADLPRAQLPASTRVAGAKIARAPHRESGRTSARLHLGVLEMPPPDDPDSPLAFSMEGSPSRPPGRIEPTFWAPGWNSPQALTRFQEEIDGPLRGGDPGARLIEPTPGDPPYAELELPSDGPALSAVPTSFAMGSEELSALAPGVAALAPRPHLELHPDDAAALGAGEGDDVELHADGASVTLPILLDSRRARGTMGVPAGLEAVPLALAWRAAIRVRT